MDKIPATPPRGAIGANAFDAVAHDGWPARRILAGLGLCEAQGQTLLSSAAAFSEEGAPAIALQNPLSADMNVFRPGLLPGLLESLRHASRKNGDVALFEIGRVFMQVEGKIKEERRLGLALTGRRWPVFWSGADRDAKYDVYDLKGALEEFFEQFGLGGVTWARRERPGPFFLESALVQLGRLTLGGMGRLSPILQKRYDLREAAFLAELNFDLILSRRIPARSFKPLPAFPAIRRDVAMLVPEATLLDAVLSVVKQAKTADLEKTEILNVFRGATCQPARKASPALSPTAAPRAR